jgi:hypothetical protein
MRTTLQTILPAALRYTKRAVTLAFQGLNGHTAETHLRQRMQYLLVGLLLQQEG